MLQRNLKRASDLGYTYYIGLEIEFFYFKDNESTQVLDHSGYFDQTSLDVGSELRRETVLTLEQMGLPVEYSHHEVAPSQHEIDLRYGDALTMADAVMTYRLAVKEVATSRGVYATFMPKPINGVNGSGMHVSQSLFRGEGNAFYGKGDEYHLSDLAKHFVAGQLAHAREISVVTNQWVNSYKRLVPGFEAPVNLTWAKRSRSDLVRIPDYRPGRGDSTRVEYRRAGLGGQPLPDVQRAAGRRAGWGGAQAGAVAAVRPRRRRATGPRGIAAEQPHGGRRGRVGQHPRSRGVGRSRLREFPSE